MKIANIQAAFETARTHENFPLSSAEVELAREELAGFVRRAAFVLQMLPFVQEAARWKVHSAGEPQLLTFNDRDRAQFWALEALPDTKWTVEPANRAAEIILMLEDTDRRFPP